MNGQDSAFPLPKGLYGSDGLTKREWFAGQALRGAIDWRSSHTRPEEFDVKKLAQDCFAIADTMIAEGGNK